MRQRTSKIMSVIGAVGLALVTAVSTAVPAQAHDLAVNNQINLNSGVATVGTSTYESQSYAGFFWPRPDALLHHSTAHHRHLFNPGPGKTLQVRSQTYCVRNQANQTVAILIGTGTVHGPAGGTGTFNVTDPIYDRWSNDSAHCQVAQTNSEIIERSEATGAQTAYRLLITQRRLY